ncbi:hypothetical protein THC_0294 [Caldimicrobium thiodismutans]|jgi:F-type H+-transporting ATPase subunit b|uniref:ATP synthase subunit b n=1 Tax=Caldimicrobium thiodismutans TaxID=1653476 RepID=A0A0U5AKS9_9BACT|nr:hypothetical protein [Caldimicrobium thiodismutans]BAU22692.1 hypothetical protein THC_0294 [Caldimicrobium thiodismutans]
MLKFDITLLVQIIEALVLAFLLNIILIKPVMSFLEERKRQFGSLEKEIDELLSQAEEGLKNYYEALNQARSEGALKREALKEEARKIEKEELQKVMKEIEAQKREWENAFKAEFAKLRESVLAQKDYFANLMVEKLLGRRV